MTAGRLYEFGRFRLDADGRLLFRGGERILLTPKAVDVLLALVESQGAPVARQDLLTKVWSDTAVEEGTLSSHISLLRKTLGRQFIETIPKRGYRFVGAVEERPRERVRDAAGRILLAVLPFENLSAGRKDDSFSDGLTEEMITQLGRLNPGRLGVIARTSSMTYKSTDKTIEQIGRELGVSHVLEGSVRRAGSRVRIAAQLIQVSDQTHVWADSYEAELEDILTLQSRVSRAVADQIQIKLLAQGSTRQVVPRAYEAYLKARYLWNRRTEKDLQMSIRYFEEAVERDPAYAAPYAGMADAYLTLMDYGFLLPREATAKARAVVAKALQLDESLADAHISLAHASMHEFDWKTAEREFVRGFELNPNYAAAHLYYSNYLTVMGRLEEAVAEAEQTEQLDPVSPAAGSNLGAVLWYSRQYERSIEQCKKVLEMNPEHYRTYEDLGRAYEQTGALDAAIEAFQTAASFEEQAHTSLASLAYAYALAGKQSEATEILGQLQQAAKTSFVSAHSFALIFVGLGRNDEAFAWFDKAYDERSSTLPFVKVSPRFDSLHGDPRFQKLLERVGLT